MSSNPTFIVSQTKEVEEEELLVIDQGRSHTSSPRSRPNSRLEILIMEMVRSQEEMARSQVQKLEGFAPIARSTEGKLDGLARGQADRAYIMGRISSVEVSLHDTPSPSPIQGLRGSSPSAETMHVSVPSTSGYLVPYLNHK